MFYSIGFKAKDGESDRYNYSNWIDASQSELPDLDEL
jgi:hypothetical protein